MYYYKKHIGDYAKKAGRLSILQHGVYNLLMDSCFDRETFPTMEEAIDWVWASSAEEILAVEFVLKKFFRLEGGVYKQSRIEDDIQEYHAQCSTNSLNGKKGGRPKKKPENKPKETQSVNSETHSVNLKSEPKANESLTTNHKPLTINQEPLTTNHKPLTINKTLVDSGESLESLFDEFWQAYPQKKSKAEAKKSWLKIKPSRELLDKILMNISSRIALGEWSLADKQYIPHPTTYLNQSRWDDEVYSKANPQVGQEKAERDAEIDAWINGEERDWQGNITKPALNDSNILEGDFQRG